MVLYLAPRLTPWCSGSPRSPAAPSTAAKSSFGYIVGFLVAAALVGWLAERGWDRTLAG